MQYKLKHNSLNFTPYKIDLKSMAIQAKLCVLDEGSEDSIRLLKFGLNK